MIIRKYRSSDCSQIAELFYNTVHKINAKDYSKEQLDMWATGQIDLKEWDRSFREHYTLVAVDDETIVGFGDIDRTGYLDRLYVHKDYQRKGIAGALCSKLEQVFDTDRITTHASVTARKFFESRGYSVAKEQYVDRKGIFLKNYVMIKER